MTEGEFVRQAREHAGLTQMGLSKKLGFSNPQFISNIERSKSSLPPIHMKKFCKITKADIEALIKIKTEAYSVSLWDHAG
jgi:transcriptional regulator with XRE-family HTH domain